MAPVPQAMMERMAPRVAAARMVAAVPPEPAEREAAVEAALAVIAGQGIMAMPVRIMIPMVVPEVRVAETD